MSSKERDEVAAPPLPEDSVEAVSSASSKDRIEVADTLPLGGAVGVVPPVPSKLDPGSVVETLSLEYSVAPAPVSPSAPSAAGPPVDRWDHYEVLELLGKGGMGEVCPGGSRPT